MKQVILSIIFCVFILSGCKDKVTQADDLRLEDRFKEAAELYQQAADEGNAYAKWRLSNAYAWGLGVDFDVEKAWVLLNEAYKAGCPQATADIAEAYMSGHFRTMEVTKDATKGKEMLEKLCKNTDDTYSLTTLSTCLLRGLYDFSKDEERAIQILKSVKVKNEESYQYLMAYLSMNGIGDIPLDHSKTVSHVKTAYKYGSAAAAGFLGDVFINGVLGQEKDIPKAIEWYEKGVRRRNTNCMKALFSIYLSEDTIYNKWKNTQMGIDLLKRAGKLGDGDAYASLGVLYNGGEHVYKDDDKYFEYTQKGAELGSAMAICNLGVAYASGYGVEKDLDKAVALWSQASESSDMGAAAHASLILYSHYLGKDNALSKKHLLKAAKQGSKDASRVIGFHYYDGSILFERNYNQAFAYFKQAADMGDITACEKIAYMYEKGEGCERNPEKAKEYRDKTKAKDTDKGQSSTNEK